MAFDSLKPGAGARLHQFALGAIPIAAYLAGSEAPVWAALLLSLAAVLSVKFILIGHLWSLTLPPAARPSTISLYHGIHRWDESLRAILLGTGLALLRTGHPSGWSVILASSAVAVLAGTTGFSFVTVLYAVLRIGLDRLLTRQAARTAAQSPVAGNPKCLLCSALGAAPCPHCLWCRLPSITTCWNLQTSLVLALMLAISFLLASTFSPLFSKILVTMSIVGIAAVALAISRQSEELLGTLDGLAEEYRRAGQRCDFLKQLTKANSVQVVAEAAVGFTAASLGARRVSLMLAKDDVLRIIASRGIPEDIAKTTAVPIGERLCGRVFASGRPLILQDIGVERKGEALGFQGEPGVASCPLVTAQMLANGRKVGVINATDRPGGSFSQRDLDELMFIAEATAIAMDSQMTWQDLEQANYASLVTLAAAMEAKDPYTNGHSSRVHMWAPLVGKELGLTGERLRTLSYAAELHDIGKLGVPDSVLKAARRLSDEEWAIVREHPQKGVELLKHLTFLKDAQQAILHHHERLDGTGYPDGLKGDQIPLEARILAVVDSYDAMTSARAYRRVMSHEAAAAELRRCAGAQFEPTIVEAFLQFLEKDLTSTVGAAEIAAIAAN